MEAPPVLGARWELISTRQVYHARSPLDDGNGLAVAMLHLLRIHAYIWCRIRCMSENPEIHEIPTKKTRKAYVRRAPQEIPAPIPQPPAQNPHILAMQAEILGLVGARSQASQQIALANRKLQMAQNELRAAQEEFQRFESEVQYRMQLISQMGGGPAPGQPQFTMPSAGVTYVGPPPPMYMPPTYAPPQGYPQYPPEFSPGVASYPAPNRGLYPDVVGNSEGAITGSAEEARREEIRLRGY
jgi:hypothetical protein